MTRKLNVAEEKEKKTDEAKPVQKKKTMNRGKENVCGFRKHRNLQHKNSLNKYRPKCKKVWEEL